MIDRMAEIALDDGPVALEAARLLMAYAFGIPGQAVDGRGGLVLINQTAIPFSHGNSRLELSKTVFFE